MKFIIFIFLFFRFSCLNGQISFAPKMGIELDGFTALACNQEKRQDVKFKNPQLSPLFGLDFSLVKKRIKYSLIIETKSVTTNFSITNDSAIVSLTQPNYTNAGWMIYTGYSSVFLGLGVDRINKRIRNFKLFRFEYGVNVGININASNKTLQENPELTYLNRSVRGNNSFNIFLKTFRRGNGLNIKLKAALAVINKKSRPYMRLEAYWNQGILVMNNYSLDFDYSVPSIPNSYRSYSNYKFNTKGTTTGLTFSFPIYLSRPTK